MNHAFLLMSVVAVVWSSNAYSVAPIFKHNLPMTMLDGDLQSQLSVDLEPLSRSMPGVRGAFGLDGLQNSLVRRSLERHGLHPNLSIKLLQKTDLKGLGLQANSRIKSISDFEYQLGDVALCNARMRAVEELTGETVIVGGVPLVAQTLSLSPEDWPEINNSAQMAIDSIANHQGHNPKMARVTSVRRCYYNLPAGLEPAWDFILRFGEFQYSVQSDESKVLQAMPRHLDATATVQAYSPNILSGTLQNYSIDVTGDGTMTNAYFTTSIYSGAARATSGSNIFSYSGTNTPSSEASAFAYVNSHYDYVASNGYVWSGPKPLTVNVYATIKANVNNALYTPFDGTSGPHIYVGEGDGVVLRNLAFDTDVVSHELGHHVIYQAVTFIGGESLVLHEGLADFLSFSRTGDACLGESICPPGTTMSSCKISNNQCLRTGNNTLVYQGDTYRSYSSFPHQQGMLISGFLWDLRKNNIIPSDVLIKYVLEAITYLPDKATIKNFMASLYYVDSKNSKTYFDGINTTAIARGLDASTLAIDLSSLEVEAGAATATAPPAESKKEKGIFGCGTLGAQSGLQKSTSSSASSLWLLAFAVFPLFLEASCRRIKCIVRTKGL